eukprot:COSAG05_NODE_6301_length_984_cov_1.474576_1_plen_187_part_00
MSIYDNVGDAEKGESSAGGVRGTIMTDSSSDHSSSEFDTVGVKSSLICCGQRVSNPTLKKTLEGFQSVDAFKASQPSQLVVAAALIIIVMYNIPSDHPPPVPPSGSPNDNLGVGGCREPVDPPHGDYISNPFAARTDAGLLVVGTTMPMHCEQYSTVQVQLLLCMGKDTWHRSSRSTIHSRYLSTR